MAMNTKAARRQEDRRQTVSCTIEEEDAGRMAVARQTQPPTLRFSHAGWCEELKRSYYIGAYAPRDWDEYEALAKYADKEGAR